MDTEKQKALEAAGWKFGDAADFLGMDEAERQELDLRVSLIRAIRTLREKLGLTQKDLAIRLKTSQPRVAKIERGAGDVSLDQIFRAYLVMGGRVAITELTPHSGNGTKNGAMKGKKKSKTLAG